MPLIPPEEFSKRQIKCFETMERMAIDCTLILPGSNFRYFSGLVFQRERHRLSALVLTRNGLVAIFGAVFEEKKMTTGPTPLEVHAWTDSENQYRLLAHWIEGIFGRKPNIALEPTTNYYHYIALASAMPGASFSDGTAVTDRLRAKKSESEIACLREACKKTWARMDKVPSLLEEGMTESELKVAFGEGAMVQFGLTTSTPNEVGGTRVLKTGDPIVIDAGDRVEGYRSDLTRTFFLGKPSSKAKDVYKLVEEAEFAAIDAVGPGIPAWTVDLAARRVIEKAGLGAFFTHRAGHGLGLDFHEIPICAVGSGDVLEPGMVLTVEPGVYLPSEFGVRLEDDLLITENGCELLSDRGPSSID